MDSLDTVEKEAQEQLEAVKLIREWSPELRATITKILTGASPSAGSDYPTKACPECGKQLDTRRKPTLHLNTHDISQAEKQKIIDSW
ncbi:MAG: hypothetical protein WDZ96_00180 [Acidimicrobiia bacterium]